MEHFFFFYFLFFYQMDSTCAQMQRFIMVGIYDYRFDHYRNFAKNYLLISRMDLSFTNNTVLEIDNFKLYSNVFFHIKTHYSTKQNEINIF